MATITLRSAKGSPLTNAEVDNNFSNLNTELGQKESASNKGQASGYASLDGSGKVPSSQLPSYVDDVVEAANFLSLPGTGETGKIYVALDTNKTYRWSGSAYVEISASPGSTDAVPEGSTNLYFTNARARAAVGASGSLSYSTATGIFSYTQPTNVSAFTNDSGYLTGITGAQVTSALGYTPANKAGDTFTGNMSLNGFVTLRSSDGLIFPVTDGGAGLGGAGNRFNHVYASALYFGSSNTSVATALAAKADASSLSSYLPLSGGTMTGVITTVSSGTAINFSGQSDSIGYNATTNLGTYIKGTGNTYIYGGGEFYDGTASRQILTSGNYSSYTVARAGGSYVGRVVFPSGVSDRPQLPGGILGLDTGDGNFDIWGISRDYYPSNATASNAWGIRWDGDSNQVRFIGAGTTRLAVDLDGGASGLTWEGNTALHAANYSSYALPLSGGTVTGSLTVNNSLSFGGFSQNLPESGLWSYITNYAYDPVNSVRWYWHKLCNLPDTSYALIEYHAKDDSNYPHSVRGYIDVASYNGTSVSIKHDATIGFNGSEPQVRIDNNSDVWIRIAGITWNNYTAWRVLHRQSVTFYRNETKQFDTPANSIELLPGQQVRATRGSVTGASIANTTTYAGYLYSRGDAQILGYIGIGQGPDSSYRVITNGHIYANSSGNVYAEGRHYSRHGTGTFYESLTTGNYTSYSPSLTGSGASGTWGISITGNAATATSATDSTKLPLSGGNVSGTVTFGSYLRIASDNSDWGTGNYFRGATDHFVLGVQSGGTLYLNYGNEAGTTRISGTTLVNGNQVLHAANYNSYALPLSGGTVTGQATFSKTDDHAISVGTIRGRAVGGQGGEFVHIYERVHIGSPSGWGSRSAPTYGLSTYGGCALATDTGSVTIAGNTALHAGNYTSYVAPAGGGWYGLNLPGSRWYGWSVGGGEVVMGQNLPNAGQMGMLLDGCYIAGEGNGFWSLPSDSNWSNRRGFYWDGSNLNFTTNQPQAAFSRLTVGGGGNSSWINMEDADEGVRYLHNNSSTIGFVANDGNWSFRVQDGGNVWFRNRGWFDDVVMRKDTGQTMSGNLKISPVSEAWAEGLTFIMPTTTQWGGLRWQRQRGNYDGNWGFGYTALDSSDDLVLVSNNGGTQINNHIRFTKTGAVSMQAGQLSVNSGYISNGNPWGTSNSAFFPNGITTANTTNWIYGHCYLGNAPSNGSGAQIESNGKYYSQVSTGLAMHVRSTRSSSETAMLVEQNRGDHSWGIVSEFRVGADSGTDRPSILFSSGYNSDTWTVGFGYVDSNFRINRDHGYRNGGWGATLMVMDRSGNVTFSGNVTAYSDRRLKTEIKRIENAGDIVRRLEGVSFKYREDGRDGIGLIAQDVELVLPQIVGEATSSDGSAYKNVAYGNVVAVLIEAIKELQNEVASLKSTLH